MGVRVRERVGLENDLRLAIESGQLEVHYQPQVSIASGAAVGVEALARWNHPDRGPISPVEFVPVAEETGLIIPLQYFVISTAIDQLRSWESQGLAQFRLAINLSAACLRLPELAANLRSVLRDRRVEPSRVQFEITESMALADPESALSTLAAVRDLGATIALDDFGTGYSSFRHLRQLPIDAIKLDISLVRDIPVDPTAGAIATAVLSMARELGLTVIAEGVETEEQLDALRQRGCHEYQGFLFSKALPADEVTALLRKRRLSKTRRRRPRT
jgi:EAL domain-containing protein (putative c-di-GMP-specific phosphodiesterase class I)